jgi:hypothetical protein
LSKCSSCNGGYYLLGTSCPSHSTCGAGTHVQTAGTTTANTVCATPRIRAPAPAVAML